MIKKSTYSFDQQQITIVQLRRKLAKYENDPLRTEMIAKYDRIIAEKDKRIERLQETAAKSKEKHEADMLSLREKWKDADAKCRSLSNSRLTRAIHDLERNLKTQKDINQFLRNRIERMHAENYSDSRTKLREIDELKTKCSILEKERIRLETELTEQKSIVERLQYRLRKNSKNSSMPSSMDKPYQRSANTYNSRIKESDRTVGGQQGHNHYARKNIKATKTIIIPPTQEILENTDLYATGETIGKKLVNIRFQIETTEFITPVYRSKTTDVRYHAPFPKGLSDEITYGSDIEALILWLTNYCNVSIRKTQEFLSEITDNQLIPSVGYINELLRKFNNCSAVEQSSAYNSLLSSKVMNVDSTRCNVNGANKVIYVFTNGNEAYYAYRDGKSINDLKDTPLDGFAGALVHDHETTFYRFGERKSHQECIAHILRYLKAAIEEVPSLTWHTKMHEFFLTLIKDYHTDIEKIDYESVFDEYHQILAIARREYEQKPPNKYMREGYKLFVRLQKYDKENFLFLKDPDVPLTNNICERLLRIIKRKAKQAVVFRSSESVKALCNFVSIIETAKLKNLSPFQQIGRLLSE